MHIKTALLGATSLVRPALGVVMMAPALSIDDMQSRIDAIVASADAFRARMEAGEELTDEETTQIEDEATELEKLNKQIKARKLLEPKGQGRKSAAEPQNRGDGDGKRPIPASARDSQRHNFVNVGEFAKAVHAHRAGRHESEGVQKLLNAATTYGNEGTGADGGFLVPPEFSQKIWQKVEAEENLMSRCTELTPSGNSMTLPKDETTPWGTSGIQAYWEAEGAAGTGTKGVFESTTQRLHKLFALAPVSEEMLEDSTGFESWIMAKVPGIISHKVNTAIVSGTGAGQPLGIITSASKVSVAKETSQPADTIWFDNINKMWARMYAPWRRNAIWLINQDIEPSLAGMAFTASGAASKVPGTSAVPAYMPANGLSGSPYATLINRPVVPVSACKTIGDQGDIILVDLKQYFLLRKAQGVRTDTSMHLYFDQDMRAFRFIFRVNGMPMWSSAITPENGSNTLSWAVVLDAR
jgi:HK97 family phage major capsid protein